MTNLEYLRTLGAEELAGFITSCNVCEKAGIKRKCGGGCEKNTIEWLNQERKLELKPCPFCGGEPKKALNCYGDGNYIRCSKCLAKIYPRNTEWEAIEAWNRRTDE